MINDNYNYNDYYNNDDNDNDGNIVVVIMATYVSGRVVVGGDGLLYILLSLNNLSFYHF